jgi:hypothetical protein
MSLLLLAAAIPVALTNDDPSQLATTGPPTTRPTTTTFRYTLEPNPNAVTTTTETPAPTVAGSTVTTARRTTRRTTRTTAPARRSTATPTTASQPATTSRPPTTTAPTTTSTTIIPASGSATPCTDASPVLADHQVAFVRSGDLWLTGVGGPFQLTTTGDASKPAWAPNGTQLVFVRPSGLFTMAPTPGGPTTALTTNAGDTDPAWSPDRERIAFVRGGDIYTVSPAGGTLKRVVDVSPSTPLGSPTWSPGSCDLAFTWKTYVLKARSSDGSGITQVRNNASEPAWGPSKVAVSAGAGLYLVNPDGSALSPFTNDGGRLATWKVDGSAIAYRSASGIVSRTVDPVGAAVAVTDQPGDTDPAW